MVLACPEAPACPRATESNHQPASSFRADVYACVGFGCHRHFRMSPAIGDLDCVRLEWVLETRLSRDRVSDELEDLILCPSYT